MDFETYARSKFADYAALAETVAAILRAAIVAYPETFRLQQVQQRPKDPESLRKKLEDRDILATTALEDQIKDLAGCRLIFYTNSDVARFLQSGIIQDNFDVDWDRTKIHHPVPGQTEPDTLFISNNYVVKLKADRAALPEYARFGDLWCEVQVQTTLNGDAPEGLIEAIFLPAIEYFTERRDARWVNLLWFLPQERSPLCALRAEQTDVVLGSLVYLRRIETHAERVLSLMAKSQPEKVFDFFGERLTYARSREDEDSYEEIPFQFHGLEKTFGNIANHAVRTVRQWFVSGDAMFQFRGGRLLASSFPNFPEVFSRELLSYVRAGNRDDIEFVIRIMASYHGEAFLNETCKAVVRALPAGDQLLPDVEIILQSTGVVAGEFGFVEAYTKKKKEIAPWLTDHDAHVRAFAESYVRLLDRQIAAEQRRSEENVEMRKRMYDDPGGLGESQI